MSTETIVAGDVIHEETTPKTGKIRRISESAMKVKIAKMKALPVRLIKIDAKIRKLQTVKAKMENRLATSAARIAEMENKLSAYLAERERRKDDPKFQAARKRWLDARKEKLRLELEALAKEEAE